MTRWSMLLCGATLWLGACGPPLGQAVLMTDRGEYAPGAELTLRLHNGSHRALGYNLCGVSLQRHEETAWEQIPTTQEGVCQAILLRLGPGRAESTRVTLEEALSEGEYRFVTHVEWDGEREEVASEPFQVVRQPAL